MNSSLVLVLVGAALLLANAAAVASGATKAQLFIKSSLGVTKPRGFSEGFSTVAQEWSQGDKYATTSGATEDSHDQTAALQDKSDGGILDTLILGLPVLFLPALLLALLYLIWAGSYSSYNYHNNYPNSYGTHGGPAVGFGHYGNGLQGGHGHGGGGKLRKTDRLGEAASISQAYVAQRVNQATPSVLGSINKLSAKYPTYSHGAKV